MNFKLTYLRPLVVGVMLVVSMCFAGGVFAQQIKGDDGGASAPSLARNQIMFRVKSSHPHAIDLAFYADGRKHSWPGSGRVYTIRDYKMHAYVLNCIRGEKICYGAGVRNAYRKYWGVGIGNRHRCRTCCYRCQGQRTKVIVLNP